MMQNNKRGKKCFRRDKLASEAEARCGGAGHDGKWLDGSDYQYQ